LDAGEVVLAAGALHSTEILLRSRMHGLRMSPRLGTSFSGNGDFFALAYNCDVEIDMLGYSSRQGRGTGQAPAPGPSIVGLVRYTNGGAHAQQIAVEDFGISSAYIHATKIAFAAHQGERTSTLNQGARRARILRDLNLLEPARKPGSAMQHTMLYLAMGRDNAGGTIVLDTSPSRPEGRARVSWDRAGRQQIFSEISEELRRHARALGGNYIPNPSWSAFNLGHLFTGHPLGGCPMGDDYEQGAVDPFGRVFAGDGGVHRGLYVSDGSVIRGSLGVNPLLTIAAITERFAEHRIRELKSSLPAASTAGPSAKLAHRAHSA
jgi:cholesterol oxidase